MRRVEVTLVAVTADGSKRDIPMKRARLVIGRKPECDVRIPVPSVSREHCEVRVEGGKVVVKDLGSSNGTYVNRERVQETELAPGHLIGVGPAVFVVRIDGNPARIEPELSFAKGSAPEPAAATSAPAARPQSPAKPGKPAPAKSIVDDDDDDDLKDKDGSSEFDFDFMDDDDEKKQPRL